MKTPLLILFAFTVIIQWLAPMSQIWKYENVLAKGTLVQLKCSAPDPYDPLRGRYLAVRPTEMSGKFKDGEEVDSDTTAYAILEKSEDGLSHITSLTKEPPTDRIFVKVKTSYANNIEWPFDRFYLNEKLAPEADKWFAEALRGKEGVIAQVRVLEGHAVLEDLNFDGKSFRDLLKERIK